MSILQAAAEQLSRIQNDIYRVRPELTNDQTWMDLMTMKIRLDKGFVVPWSEESRQTMRLFKAYIGVNSAIFELICVLKPEEDHRALIG